MIPASRLKAALRIDTIEDAYEEEEQVAYLEDLEAAAVAFVERYTGRGFGGEDDEAVFVVQGSGDPTLWLPQYVSAVASVVERPYLATGADETEIATDADDGWELRILAGGTHSNKLVRRGGGVWSAWMEYVVTGTAGYAEGAEPADIRQAVTALVAHWWEQRVPVAVGTVAPEVNLHVRELLAPWRRMVA